MPLHKDKNHWVALVADFVEKKIMVLDSLGRDDDFEREMCQVPLFIPTITYTHERIRISGRF